MSCLDDPEFLTVVKEFKEATARHHLAPAEVLRDSVELLKYIRRTQSTTTKSTPDRTPTVTESNLEEIMASPIDLMAFTTSHPKTEERKESTEAERIKSEARAFERGQKLKRREQKR